MTGGAAPKRKGAAFERDVVDYLRANGFPDAARAYGAGRPDDRGDIAGVPGTTVQVRNTNRIELADAVDTANRQRMANRSPYHVAIIKRKGRSVRDAYVVQTLAQWCATNGGPKWRFPADDAPT